MQIIYNVTTAVNHQVNEAWLQWMKDIHIPEVLGTGCFVKHQLVKILDTDESEGFTYAVQYYAESQAKYDEYISYYANDFRKAITVLWGENVLSFRTLMAVLA
ncbi:MAG: DUF4286 family protein [Bacteroidota bacterium]